MWTTEGEAICRLIAGYADIISAQTSPALRDDDGIVTEELKVDQKSGQVANSLCMQLLYSKEA